MADGGRAATEWEAVRDASVTFAQRDAAELMRQLSVLAGECVDGRCEREDRVAEVLDLLRRHLPATNGKVALLARSVGQPFGVVTHPGLPVSRGCEDRVGASPAVAQDSAAGDASAVVDERFEPGALDRAAVLARYRTVRGWNLRGPLGAIEHIHHALAEGIAVDARRGRAQARELRLLAAASEYRESINRRAGVYSLAGRSRASAAFWRTGDLRIAREVRLQVAAAVRDHKK